MRDKRKAPLRTPRLSSTPVNMPFCSSNGCTKALPSAGEDGHASGEGVRCMHRKSVTYSFIGNHSIKAMKLSRTFRTLPASLFHLLVHLHTPITLYPYPTYSFAVHASSAYPRCMPDFTDKLPSPVHASLATIYLDNSTGLSL